MTRDTSKNMAHESSCHAAEHPQKMFLACNCQLQKFYKNNLFKLNISTKFISYICLTQRFDCSDKRLHCRPQLVQERSRL